MVGYGFNAARKDEPPAPIRSRLLLMGMATVHNNGSLVDALLKETLIGIDLELVRDVAIAIGEHAVSGDNSVAFDANVF